MAVQGRHPRAGACRSFLVVHCDGMVVPFVFSLLTAYSATVGSASRRETFLGAFMASYMLALSGSSGSGTTTGPIPVSLLPYYGLLSSDDSMTQCRILLPERTTLSLSSSTMPCSEIAPSI